MSVNLLQGYTQRGNSGREMEKKEIN